MYAKLFKSLAKNIRLNKKNIVLSDSSSNEDSIHFIVGVPIIIILRQTQCKHYEKLEGAFIVRPGVSKACFTCFTYSAPGY